MTDQLPSVYERLSEINVNDHKQKKGNFDYLSWTWAIDAVKRSGLDFSYELLDDQVYNDGSMEVRCSVTLDSIRHVMWLAVTDHNNRAIKNPDAAAINKARMRCLVKAIAIHGLGFYIYAGEDLPATTLEVYEEFMADIESNEYKVALKYVAMTEDEQVELSKSAPAGHKVELKAKLRELSGKVHEVADSCAATLGEQLEANDTHGVIESVSELVDIEKKLVWARITPEQKSAITEIFKEQKNA